MTREDQHTDLKSLRTVTGKLADWAALAQDCVCFANGAGGRLFEGMTARELKAVVETEGGDDVAVWLGRLPSLALVQTVGRTQGTRYFVDPALLQGAQLFQPTTLARIEPHRLQELIREDLRRYPDSKIGEISLRIGQEVNRSQLKRALTELADQSVVGMTGLRNGARYRLIGS